MKIILMRTKTRSIAVRIWICRMFIFVIFVDKELICWIILYVPFDNEKEEQDNQDKTQGTNHSPNDGRCNDKHGTCYTLAFWIRS